MQKLPQGQKAPAPPETLAMSTKTRHLRRIKLDTKSNVEIIFEERVIIAPGEKEEDSREKGGLYIFKGDQKPHDDLVQAMTKLRKFALESVEMPEDTKLRNQFSVVMVDIAGDMDLQNSRVKFLLSKYVKRSNANVTFGPLPQIKMYGDEFHQAKEMTKGIEELAVEVWAYMEGKNADKVKLAFSKSPISP